ncbi:hypothetical protein C8F04DRAFT_1090953 [Mycena alexandri]|uniref:F-box domain-containing protein n=1 Tax=Mycena alexandri TaxID=1745969 RepID=A0AAD6T378_9AGAR|nr:hypothetical protein C8F04DRAFT_1090953 [Mycena alexandri]
MHHCLKILEIVDAICVHLDPPFNRVSSFRDLAAVARTCTTFSGPALDHLWKSPPLDRLLTRCMPSDLWELERELKPLRPIRARDWDRLRLYAPRVRILASHDDNWLSSDALQALSVSLPERLFQNLKTLNWEHLDDEFHYIRLFLSSTLTSLRFALTSFPAVSLLSTLASVCPRLTDVSIKSSGYTKEISEFVCAIQRPEKLKLLVHLSRLQTLKSLDLNTLPSGLNMSSVQGTNTFSALRTLRLTESDSVLTTEFLGLCSGVPLKKFGRCFDEFTTAAKMHALFIAMAAGFSHTSLEQLVLDNGCEEAAGADPAVYLISHHSLLPLLCFTNLVILCIASPMGFDLDDGAVSDFARALPHVETFQLTACFPTHIPPNHPRYCPRLSTLGIALDATTVPTIDLNRSQDGGVLQLNLGCLDVEHSTVGRAMPVARFLSSVFPNLDTIYTHREHFPNGEEEMLEHGVAIGHHNRWKEVAELLFEVPAIREEGRALERKVSGLE